MTTHHRLARRPPPRSNPANIKALKSRSITRQGVAAAVCKERLPGHAVLGGLLAVLITAADAARSHGERVPKSVSTSILLLGQWRRGSGIERDLDVAIDVLRGEREAYTTAWNKKMAHAFDRGAAGEDPQYPRATFDHYLRDVAYVLLQIAPALIPLDKPCSPSTVEDILKDAQATILVLISTSRSEDMKADRAAGEVVLLAFREGVRVALADPPSLRRYVLIPPPSQAQIDFGEQRRRERFMGAFGVDDERRSTMLMGYPLPYPENEDPRADRLAREALADIGMIRRYEASDVIGARNNPKKRR